MDTTVLIRKFLFNDRREINMSMISTISKFINFKSVMSYGNGIANEDKTPRPLMVNSQHSQEIYLYHIYLPRKLSIRLNGGAKTAVS